MCVVDLFFGLAGLCDFLPRVLVISVISSGLDVFLDTLSASLAFDDLLGKVPSFSRCRERPKKVAKGGRSLKAPPHAVL